MAGFKDMSPNYLHILHPAKESNGFSEVSVRFQGCHGRSLATLCFDPSAALCRTMPHYAALCRTARRPHQTHVGHVGSGITSASLTSLKSCRTLRTFRTCIAKPTQPTRPTQDECDLADLADLGSHKLVGHRPNRPQA